MKTEKDTHAPLSPGDTVRAKTVISPLRGSVGQVVAVDESRLYPVTVQVQTFSEAAERAGLPYQLNAPFFSFMVEELEPVEQKQ